MSVQTSIGAMGGALAGMWADSWHGRDSLSAQLPAASVAKVVATVVTTATNSTLYTIAADGIRAVYNSDGSATKGEIRDGLIAYWNGNAACAAKATAAALAADSFTLTGVVPGDDFVVVVEGATLTPAVTTAAVDATNLGFGYGVARNALGIVRQMADGDAYTAFQGVALHTHDMDPTQRPAANTPDGYFGVGRTVSVVKKGRVNVKVSGTVTEGSSSVYLYVSGPNKGLFAGSGDGSLTVTLTGNVPVKWVTSSANGLAVLELNLP